MVQPRSGHPLCTGVRYGTASFPLSLIHICVNNRNLKDFTVDIHNSVRLRELVPENILFVSESGMKTRQDIERLEQNGTNAVLIGETLMRSADKKAVLQELRGQCEK